MYPNSSINSSFCLNNKKAMDTCSVLLDMKFLSIVFLIGEKEYVIDCFSDTEAN